MEQQSQRLGAVRPLDREEAARFFGCHVSTLDRMRWRGEIPFVKFGGRVLFRRCDLAAYLEKNLQGGMA